MTADELRKLRITPVAGGVEFQLKVGPGASRTRIVGVLGDALKVAVAAPPEGGKANAALMAFLAEALRVKRGDVTLVSGATAVAKRVRAMGVDAGEVARRLSEAGARSSRSGSLGGGSAGAGGVRD